MSLVFGGKPYATDFESVSWLDDPKRAPRAPDSDTDPRKTWVRSIVLHTTSGTARVLKPGLSGASTRAEAYARYMRDTKRWVSWDYTVDTDGTVIVSNDPLTHYTWHATAWNRYSVGIELVEASGGVLYEGQLAVLVKLLDAITWHTGVQRCVPIGPAGTPDRRILTRADDKGALRGVDLVGVFGHRNNTRNRGYRDPSDMPFDALMKAGYLALDYEAEEDKTLVRVKQAAHGLEQDGVCGPETRRRVGQTVVRPGDDARGQPAWQRA